MTAYSLHYGNGKKPLARVISDVSGLWRIEWPDGILSDIVNLSRAKDAAAEVMDRGPPRRDRRRFRWKQDRRVGAGVAP
jgi:hypothetical protein